MYVIRRLAEFVGNKLVAMVTLLHLVILDCDACDVVLVPNVTTAMNCVLQSLAKTMSATDNVMFFNVTYGLSCISCCLAFWNVPSLVGATKKLLQYIKELVGINLVEVTLSFPIHSPQQVGGVTIIT